MLRTTFLAPVLILAAVCAPCAQGHYLADGQSGFGVTGLFGKDDESTTLGAGLGYSINGRFDIGIELSRATLDESVVVENGESYEASANSVAPYILYHAVKQNHDGTPFSVAFGAGYTTISLDSDLLDEAGLTVEIRGWQLGAEVYTDIDVNPRFQLQPNVAMIYISQEAEIKDDQGNSLRDDNTATAFRLGLSGVFKTSDRVKFVVAPDFTVVEGESLFSVSAGFVFATR